MAHPLRPVILSGGAGTRLWPLSTTRRPKQFLDILGQPLFAATLQRVEGLPGLQPLIVVTGADHLAMIEEAARGAPVEMGTIVVEPEGRNTAPAVLAAALLADSNDILVVLPSDHRITDVDRFRDALGTAAALAGEGHLVTFGIPPSRAETGYGYLETGSAVGAGFTVARFKEKPGPEEAARMAGDGRHLWNSGMFVFLAGSILAEAERHVPELVAAVRSAIPSAHDGRVPLLPSFAEVPAISLDHAVMERTDLAVVIPIEVGWSDVGSWQSLWEAAERDDDGNVLVGDVVAKGVSNSYIHASTKRVAVAGLEGVVVVETEDAVLVLPVAQSQLVRDLAVPPPDRIAGD